MADRRVYCATVLVLCLFYGYRVDVVAQSEDGDVSASTGVEPGVQEILLPMCRGLVPYTHTRLPNRYGHSTQAEIYRHIQHMWAFMDYGCSANFRLFVCSMHLPRYDTATNTTSGPCRRTCNRARGRCRRPMKQLKANWPRNYRCRDFPRRRQAPTCVREVREPNNQIQHTYCAPNTIPICQGLPYALGSLPNLFLQRNLTEIQTELNYYDNLIGTGCNPHLPFFLCGTYMPFCVHNASPFVMPCRELCEEIVRDCVDLHAFAYQGIPWPNKLQCHRFPASDSGRPCVMPGDI